MSKNIFLKRSSYLSLNSHKNTYYRMWNQFLKPFNRKVIVAELIVDVTGTA